MTAFEPYARSRTTLACLSILACLAAPGCAKKERAAPPPVSVQTAIAQEGSITPSQQLGGIIAPYENVAVQSTLTEPAARVNVQEGDNVSAGEILAQLDVSDLQAQLDADLATANSDRANTTHTVYQGSLSISQGQDALKTAQANLLRDQQDLNRYQTLYRSGYVSQQQFQQQQATVRGDQAALRSAQSTVEANGTLAGNGLQQSSIAQSQAQVQVALAQAQQIRVQISKATIASPISGVIVNRNLNPGEYPGTRQLFTIQQVDPIFAVLRGSGAEIANVHTGASVTINAGDLGKTKLTGSVVGVLNQIAPGSTNFQVKVLLRNPMHTLRPGMAVQGTIVLPGVRGVRVPETAFTDDNHDAILIVQQDSTVKTVPVTEVANDGKTSIVTGVTSGTRVVSDGQTSIGDGEKVAIR